MSHMNYDIGNNKKYIQAMEFMQLQAVNTKKYEKFPRILMPCWFQWMVSNVA